MKLHLGCGKEYIKGFINCDLSGHIGVGLRSWE